MTNNKTIIKLMKGNKHFKHILTNETVKRMCMIEDRYSFTKLPVCSGCERLALWTRSDRGGKACYCTMCNTYTREPMTYSDYLANGEDIDATGKTFREMSEKEKTKLVKDRILYV